MTEHSETLLHKVKRLYSELFLTALHNRINSYHSFMHSNKHNEIGDTLHDLIEEIVREASSSGDAQDYKDIKQLDARISSVTEKLKHIRTQSQNSEPGVMTDLSVHLKKQYAQESEDNVSSKLRKSVWDHVHAAHRFARSGNSESAKLHVDLATNAMQALSHYMPVDEYGAFLTEISKQIQSMGKSATSTNETAAE